jgi:hypothetical protein
MGTHTAHTQQRPTDIEKHSSARKTQQAMRENECKHWAGPRGCAHAGCTVRVLAVCVLVECASEKTSANRLTILPVWHRVNSTQQLRECAVGWRDDSVRHGSQQDRGDEWAKLGSWRWRQQGRVKVVVCGGCQGGKIFRWGAGPFKTHSRPALLATSSTHRVQGAYLHAHG